MMIEKAQKYIKENKSKVNPQYRLKFHVMPEIGWMNDPNGLSFFRGNYHIFYQHYPYESVWGDMHWGHVISKDLIKYEYAPIALAPDQEDESGCYSGGGLVKDDKLYLFYTKHYEANDVKKETQGIAISDDGIHFIKRKKPIIDENTFTHFASPSDNRDPVPYEKNGKYYIILGTTNTLNQGKFITFVSDDLKDFKYHDTIENHRLFGTMAECPDLIDTDGVNVLLYSKIIKDEDSGVNKNLSQYIIGDIDIEEKKYDFQTWRDIDSGYHFYAPQTLKDDKDRIIMIAWMEMWGRETVTHKLGHKWQGACTLPRVLTVKDHILYQWPIEEINHYRMVKQKLNKHQLISKQVDLLIDETHEAFCIKIQNTINHNEYFEFGFDGEKVYIDGSELIEDAFDKKFSQYTYDKVEMRVIFDTSSCEIFVNQGKETFTVRIFINSPQYMMSKSDKCEGHYYLINIEAN